MMMSLRLGLAALAMSLSGVALPAKSTATPLSSGAPAADFTPQITGTETLAFWPFDPAEPLSDQSGQGHTLKQRGKESRIVPDERFGGALEIDGQVDTPQGLIAGPHPGLSPAGAFTIEAWIRPAADLENRNLAFLVDKKLYHYTSDHPRANQDYLLMLSGQVASQERRLVASLGFGQDSALFTSIPITWQPERWYHVVFTYDGQGLGIFYRDGREIGRHHHPGRGPVTAGCHPLVIGDRIGSTHHRFAGAIAQVRLSRGAATVSTNQVQVVFPIARRAFLRMEPGAALPVTLKNDTDRTQSEISIQVQRDDQPAGAGTIRIESLGPGQQHTLDVPIDTTLDAGRYTWRFQAFEGDRPIGEAGDLSVQIAHRVPEGQMPIILWGNGGVDPIQAMGFNHQLVHLMDFKPVWQARGPVTDAPDRLVRRLGQLDELLIRQQRGLKFFNTINWLKRQAVNDPNPENNAAHYAAVDAEGTPHRYGGREALDPTFPRIVEHVHDMGRSVAENYGEHPALTGALVHSEVRDATQISHHQHNREAFHQATGLDYPAQLQGPRGTHHRQLPDFPADRVVEDDHPLLQFYRWFWKDGDGWNALHSRAAAGFKAVPGRDLWTFYDPAVRVPSLYGSGGEMDVISQWTYTYPDPLKIGLATDELFAMARGRPGQQVMTMTQAIWYRSQTAPIRTDQRPGPEHTAPWENDSPDAQYITIAPDIARQSLWLMLSRPVKGIMFHGLSSLLPQDVHGGWTGGRYIFTNADTSVALGEDMRRIAHPLGATLLQVPDRPSDIAFLESFTSQMFARRGGYGWAAGWSADAYLALNWAHLQPEVIYEETLLEEGLDAYRVLVLADCDVLPRSVVQAIQAWQDRGGVIIGDERLTPAVQPDILLPVYQRTRKADQDKAALQQLAANLRSELDDYYTRHLDASNPEVLVRARQWDEADYLFAINDHRTFGDYVGHHGLVMEKGLPVSATLQLHRTGGVIYDVLASRQVATTPSGDFLTWPVELAPGDGRLFLRVPRPIARLDVTAPARARPGEAVTLDVRITDARDEPVPAVLPIEVRILDAEGRPAEFSGYYGAAGGRFSLALDLPSNATPGNWRITVRDLASGLEEEHLLTLAP